MFQSLPKIVVLKSFAPLKAEYVWVCICEQISIDLSVLAFFNTFTVSYTWFPLKYDVLYFNISNSLTPM